MNAVEPSTHAQIGKSRRRNTFSLANPLQPSLVGGSKQTQCGDVFASPSPRDNTQTASSVPAKRKQQTSSIRSFKRSRPDHQPNSLGIHTPPKQIHFYSSPRCPPSPHHKPRTSSPLRKSAVSPLLVIKRTEPRQPLGQLTLTLQSPGSTSRRTTSKDFKLYEDTIPFKESDASQSRGAVSLTRRNNKENIAPITKQQTTETTFVRPLPRDPLNILDLSDRAKTQSEMIEHGRRTVIKEKVVKTYYAGKPIAQGTQKTTIVTTKFARPIIDDLKSVTPNPHSETWEFEIYQDEPGDNTIFDADSIGNDAIMLDNYDDKENEEPVVIGNHKNPDRNDLEFWGGTRKTLRGNRVSNSEE